jgi:hypothetical protein
MRFDRAGIAVTLPPGWEAALYRRDEHPTTADGRVTRQGVSEQALTSLAPGASTHPVLHTASFPLPPDRGDYGSGAVDVMAAQDLFVSLVEFHPDAATTPLFSHAGVPRGLSSDDFGANALQRVLTGQSGCQRFFHVNGRAFCLYVVLGSHARRHLLVPAVNQLLDSLDIASPDPAAADVSEQPLTDAAS